MAQRIGIVCGYGPYSDDNNKLYWDSVVQFFNETGIDILIPSGGYTRGKSLPGISEAAAIRAYVLPRLTTSSLLCVNEEDSYATWDNLKNVAAMVNRLKLPSPATTIVIFCHSSKKFLVEKLARHFFGPQQPIIVETAYWKMGLADVLLQPVITLGMLAARNPRLTWIANAWRTIQMKRYAKM